MGDVASAFAQFRQRSYFDSLDGLRCVSIIPVLWHHCLMSPTDGLLSKGPVGLQLFFVISGFLITTLLLRERRQHGRIGMVPFFARRALRILPLYYLTLAAQVVYSLMLAPSGLQREHFLQSVVFYATFTSNWFVDWRVLHPISFAFAWTLAAEEQFYCSFPWVLRGTRGHSAPLVVLTAVLIGSECARLWGVPTTAGLCGIVLRSVPSAIVLGAILALVLDTKAGFRALSFLAWRYSVVAMVGLVGLCLGVDATPPLVLHCALTLLVGASSISQEHALARALQWKPVQHIGRVSYGVYLFNTTIIAGVKVLLGQTSSLLVFALALPLTVMAATASFLVLEQPLLRLRRNFPRTE